MRVEVSYEVVLFPYTRKTETALNYGLVTCSEEDAFYIEVGGDHLPEGTDGYIEQFHCEVGLNADQVQELYDELGQWLNGRNGDSEVV
jgi:hypothetical protein